MTNDTYPILYSFRRCPYAMRARLAISAAELSCELREIVLREKAPEFLAASETGTVPVIVQPDGTVVEESFDIMMWALEQHDPDGWLKPEVGSVDDMTKLIMRSDGDFKSNLDRYKYPNRHGDGDPNVARAAGAVFLRELDERLASSPNLFGAHVALADMAIAPFVRQFANVDRAWFDDQEWPNLSAWLDRFLTSERFTSIMTKYPKWHAGDEVTRFPY